MTTSINSEALKNHGWINRQSETNVQWSLKIFSLFDADHWAAEKIKFFSNQYKRKDRQSGL